MTRQHSTTDGPATEKPARKVRSGWQARKLRMERGLPKYTEHEAQARKARLDRLRVERYERNRAFLDAYKLAHGCADCGYKDHVEALDFDHLPGFEKRGDLARLVHRQLISLDKLMEEAQKCEVVCANCHRVRTHERRLLSSE